ncbi:DUF1758 domain-containing protein [Trichonephila clavipes]|nr:DUF1758 domain-containing protein [Trichonephila clavipes]
MSETEKAQMAEIRAARGRVKASLTRLENTFDEINTRNEISIRLSRLDDLFKEFERLDSNLSLEESEHQEFEERYFYLNAKFNDKLDELNVQNQESRRLWAIKSSEEEFPNMKAFLDFLNVRCSSLELMLHNESECKIPIRSQTKGCVDLVIGSQSSNERLEVNAFILNKVTSQIPSEFLDVKDLDYFKSIPLSDEEFMSPKECDIILGSDCFFFIFFAVEKIVGSKK